MHVRARCVAAVLAGALALSACGDGGGADDDVEPGPDQTEQAAQREARIAEIEAAREAAGPPAAALVAQVDAWAQGVLAVRQDDTLDVSGRADAAAALPTAPVEDAVAAVEAVELDGDGSDVVAARSVLDDLVAAARDALAAGAREAAELEQLALFDADLDAVVATWDRPGSRTQRAGDLAAAQAAATALRQRAEAAEPVVPGVDVWAHRATTAGVVAERTEQLRGLVGGSGGLEFDELRDTWRADPLDSGGPLGAVDPTLLDGWGDASPTAAAVTEARDVLDALVAALDPPELRD